MAVYGRDTEDIYELIEYADFAMYEAKKAGKKFIQSIRFGTLQGKKLFHPMIPGFLIVSCAQDDRVDCHL